MKITKSQLKQIIQEEIEKVTSADDLYLAEMFDTSSDDPYKPGKRDEADRTAKGNVTQAARDDHATLSDGRFPIFDKKSALAALKLRGHGTTDAERKKIINKAAKYAPAAAKKAREADKKD